MHWKLWIVRYQMWRCICQYIAIRVRICQPAQNVISYHLFWLLLLTRLFYKVNRVVIQYPYTSCRFAHRDSWGNATPPTTAARFPSTACSQWLEPVNLSIFGGEGRGAIIYVTPTKFQSLGCKVQWNLVYHTNAGCYKDSLPSLTLPPLSCHCSAYPPLSITVTISSA